MRHLLLAAAALLLSSLSAQAQVEPQFTKELTSNAPGSSDLLLPLVEVLPVRLQLIDVGAGLVFEFRAAAIERGSVAGVFFERLLQRAFAFGKRLLELLEPLLFGLVECLSFGQQGDAGRSLAIPLRLRLSLLFQSLG